jgi:uncharacterized alpha-E superfamily protein
MLSRVANRVYWLGRYMERAENYARYLGVNFNLALDMPNKFANNWEAILLATGDNLLFESLYTEVTERNILYFMSFDQRNPNSIYSSIFQARENARNIRETITKEMWEQCNNLYWTVKNTAQECSLWDITEYQSFFEQVKLGSQLFFGIVDATITRSEAYHFGRIGRLIERADKITRFLDIQYFNLPDSSNQAQKDIDILYWTAVLKSASAYNMFRQHYQSISPATILDFLIFYPNFPRSVMFCITQSQLSLHEIVGADASRVSLQNLIKKIEIYRSIIENSTIEGIEKRGLHLFLSDFLKVNNKIDRELHTNFFDLKPMESLGF